MQAELVPRDGVFRIYVFGLGHEDCGDVAVRCSGTDGAPVGLDTGKLGGGGNRH